jgi:hypothetical protein
MSKPPREIGASVRAKLMHLARERGQVFDLLLTRYALERLLHLLSISEHRNRFVLTAQCSSRRGSKIRIARRSAGKATKHRQDSQVHVRLALSRAINPG